MWLDADRCYRALRSHDARFDGRFFVAVTSTHIYCRPVCTARAPRRENCRFFSTAAAAETQGFRPCLRCRPELAPGNASVDAPPGIAARAAGLIEDGVLADGARLNDVASRLGVTGRHLRRVFQDEFGVSPVEFAQTQRLLLAKRLLTDTRLPIIDVALASGFSSLRRFNALFRGRYRLAPTDLRKRTTPAVEDEGFRFLLRYEAPFDWPALLRFLANRTIDGVEDANGERYRRTVCLPHRGTTHAGWIEVAPAMGRDAAELRVHASLAKVLPQVVARAKRLFDLACPIKEVEEALGPLAAQHPGIRVPGAFEGFEMAVRAILGQQVTVKAARTLAGRVSSAFGDPIDTGVARLTRLFPTATTIASLAPATVTQLGVVSSRARAIIALASRVADGRLVLEPGRDVAATLDLLREIPGVGDWTAQYIAMRALAWPDAFPEGDVGIMNALQERSRARIRERALPWHPWRSYAVMHLWHGLDARASAAPVRSHQQKEGV